MRRERTLLQGDKKNLINELDALPKAREFLEDMTTRSKRDSTKNTYGVALAHLQTFLKNSQDYNGYDIETILEPLKDKKTDVYVLFRNFVSYLKKRRDEYFEGKELSPTSIILYVAGIRSYFEFYDVDISPRRFKKKVRLPEKLITEPEPIDANDITNMLGACNNKRLKAFILLLATTGLRANEALLLKNSDIDFEVSPTRIHVRAGYTKTKQERNIFTTDEASKHLKIFIDSKYKNIKYSPDHILFKLQDNNEEHKGKLYGRLMTHFSRLLEDIGMDKRKDGDGQGIQRRKISFHSFRRFVKTTISNQGYGDYSEYLLGHRSSMSAKYYSVKPQERAELYKKFEKYLTFLDMQTVESVGRDFESKLRERDQEIGQLKDGMEELKNMYLKAMAGHVVMENDLDSKGRTNRKIIKNK